MGKIITTSELKDGRRRAKFTIDGVLYQKVFPAAMPQIQADLQAKRWGEEVQKANEYRCGRIQARDSQLLLAEELGYAPNELDETPPPFTGNAGEADIAWWKNEIAKSTGASLLEKSDEPTWPDIWKGYLDYRIKKAENSKYITQSQKWTFAQVGNHLVGQFPQSDAEAAQFLEAVGDKIRKSDYSVNTKNGILRILTGFTRFLYKTSKLQNFPRNIDEITQRVKGTPKEAKRIPTKELAEIWDNAYPDMRCYICLSLNAGFYQKDIQLLTESMVDLKAKRIRGERNKTKIKYDFPMWEETVYWLKQRLEKEERLKHGGKSGYLLSTKRGGVLQSPRIMFGDIQTRIWGEQRYSYSHLRDTGATIIHKEIDASMTGMYLRHSIKGMKKWYVDSDASSPTLDKAIESLRKKFPFLKNKNAPKYSGANARKLNKKRWGKKIKPPHSGKNA